MNDCYFSLAQVYDEMMSYVPYENWVQTISHIVKTYCSNDAPTIFEIGGGTGTLGAQLTFEGYQYSGSDISEAMCQVAWGKGLDMICCDCRSLAVQRHFGLVIFLFDGINYLDSLQGYRDTFAQVAQIVEPGGYFLFDVTTEANSLGNFDDYHEAESFESGAYIRHSYYDKRAHKQVNDFEIFVQEENNPDSYSRVSEQHCQTLFSVEAIGTTIPLDLFEVVGVWDGFSQDPVKTDSERVHFLLKRNV